MDQGLYSYENWKAALRGDPLLRAYEIPLFTDVHITGGPLNFGPYQFLNPIAIPTGGKTLTSEIRPGIVLRWDNYLEVSVPGMDETDYQRYHGGVIFDEIAAISSLALGIRLKSGGVTREFDPNNADVRGKPIFYEMYKDPILIKNREGPIVPYKFESVNLDKLNPLSIFHSISSENAIALVKASRFYQDAFWICESEPELAWIMFVSAIETAAHHWRQTEESSIERLRASKPELEGLLLSSGGVDLVKDVADQIAPYMGATKKFIDFLLAFLPTPPENRPPEYARLSWDTGDLKRTFKKIYDYRSKALHAGTPFPAPMCFQPNIIDGFFAETPVGLSFSNGQSVWQKQDVPILLHTFAYIVRGALLKWWNSMK